MSLAATEAMRAAQARNALARRLLALGPLLCAALFLFVLSWLVVRAARPTPAAELSETVALEVVIVTLFQVGAALTICLPLALTAGYLLAEHSRRTWTRWIDGLLHAAASLPALVYTALALTFVFAGRNSDDSCCVFFDPVPAAALVLAMTSVPQLTVLAQAAFVSTPAGLKEECEALGLSRWRTFRTAVLPGARPRLVTATVLALTRTVGAALPVAFLDALWLGDGNRTLSLELFRETLRGAGGARHALWILGLTSLFTILGSMVRARWEADD